MLLMAPAPAPPASRERPSRRAPPQSLRYQAYEKIVAPFNAIISQGTPDVGKLDGILAATESQLSSTSWPGRTTQDVAAEVAALKAATPVLDDAARNAHFSPTSAQKKKLSAMYRAAGQVRNDLGMPQNNTGSGNGATTDAI